MNVVKAVREYVSKMVRITGGMKVLLLDPDTTGVVSVVYSQSEILQEEVYLFEQISNQSREVMAHLKAICFLQPTAENLQLLKKELRKPKYGEYYLFFTNVVTPQYLEQLAAADEHEVVHEVQEYFADYFAINPDLFTLNMSSSSCISTKGKDWGNSLQTISSSLLSVLLSLRIRPYIRAQKSSELCVQVGKELLAKIKLHKDLFKFHTPDPAPVLLLVDRRDDPVTPLLTQWTYQAMVHDLLGMTNNLVNMKNVTAKDIAQIVLSAEQDPFYKENMFSNFGDLGIALKDLAEEYQKNKKLNENITTIEDMKKFVTSYPEFKKLAGNVSKHFTLMEELQKQVANRHLLDVSEFEQTLACHQDHAAAKTQMEEFLENPDLNDEDLVQLLMLYSLRYETAQNNDIPRYLQLLQQRGVSEEKLKLVGVLKSYAGLQKRSATIDLFDNKDMFNIARGQIIRGITGVTNIYTQHKPLLSRTIQQITTGKLRELPFPFIDGVASSTRPRQVIIMIIGGVTYEEAGVVH
eukprot:TRINITY_DN10643_c0_g1_i1.p1 TRINITY_DN10643_c0_g1~~TRINITY_DN10643_c0_g1_i1.p1  ORF type:complete len:561 (+),score=134.15 TRINITY_DN10643_c0_g1_i1:119-1684(+)